VPAPTRAPRGEDGHDHFIAGEGRLKLAMGKQ